MAGPKQWGLLIGGEWIVTAERAEVRSPYNGTFVGAICRAGAVDVEEALRRATEAFEATRKSPGHVRGELCRRISKKIKERSEELAETIALEAGKPIRQARAEVGRAAVTFRLAAEEAARQKGEILPLDVTSASEGRVGLVRRYPVGPVAAITPFNFPLNLVAHKVAPALAVGCAVVHKPASSTPMTALKLGEIVTECGAVPGTYNVLPASASVIGPFVTDDRIKLVTFTGSAEVGWGIKTRCGKKRVALELGGNAAAVIEPDADLDRAVARCVLGGYAYAGQVCISVQRILVHRSIYDEFREKFVAAVKALEVGDPVREETDVGPMIDEGEAARAASWIEEAEGEGGKILCGGGREDTLVEPCVIENAPRSAKVVREEVFAPVTVLSPYDDFEEALAMVNDSKFGLQAGVFTSDLSKAMLAFNRIEAGGIIVNDAPTFRVDNYPYGGVKESGFGREGVPYAMEEMTELRILVMPDPR